MQIYSRIDIGKMRKTNQDAFFVSELDDRAAFAVVCDGMGGANAGNVASDMAVRTISNFVCKAYRKDMDSLEIEKILKNAILNANIQIYDMALKNPELSGMGTTAVAALVRDNMAVIAHVGDSRAYLVNDDIKMLTRDHSVVQSLIESGKLTPEQAKVHPRKNVITRALGAEEDVIADCGEFGLSPGDSLLLCTDGLTNFVETQEIFSTFKNIQIAGVADTLIDSANANGGGDNITAVVVTI